MCVYPSHYLRLIKMGGNSILGRFVLDETTLQRIYKRRIEPMLRRDTKRSTSKEGEKYTIHVYVSNLCDLECFSCSTLCNTPIGSNEFNREPHSINPDTLDAFLSNIGDYKPKHGIRLIGGEPTYWGGDLINRLCDIVHSHGRKVDILTNGYRFLECDLEKLDYVYLDEHVQNVERIKQCVQYMKENNYTKYKIIPQSLHRDLNIQREGYTSNGARCPVFMDIITLFKGVVFGCNIMPNLEGWDNDPRIREELWKGGWHAENPRLRSVLEYYRISLPPYILKKCTWSCWKDAPPEKIIWKPTA